MSICNICCENINKTSHTEITCPFADCGFKSCKTCVRKYLLETTADPHCMNCKKAYSVEFIIENLNRSFYENDYKKHRKLILAEREISKLPETIQAAENQKFIDDENDKLKIIKKKLDEAKKVVEAIKHEQTQCHNTIYNIEKGGIEKERKKFIMACPGNDCRGYLSTQYKCELCKLYTCPHCHDIIGHNKNDEHVCNEDSVKSAELIKKDTKPCPSCGIRIFKIDGCNQMWCTECHVAFDYVTGRIDKGIVHNPHYNAHLQQVNGLVPRDPGDVLCGGLCNWWRLKYKMEPSLLNNETFDITYVENMHRTINHITRAELPIARRNVRDYQDCQALRIDYLLKKKSINQFRDQIFRRDNQRKKYNELLHIYEFISVIGVESFNSIFNSTNKNSLVLQSECIELVGKMDQVKDIYNEQIRKIGKTYNNQVLCICKNWTRRLEKS